MALFMFGLLCAIALIVYRFFADLLSLGLKLPGLTKHDPIVGVLNLIDIVLVANLTLIVIFSGYVNYIRRIDTSENPDWPPGLTNLGFGAVS